MTRTKAEIEQEKAVSLGLDHGFISVCPRCSSTTVFDRWEYVNYLEGRGWDLSDTEGVTDQITSFESHVHCGGVDITGCGRRDADGDVYCLCGDCKAAFDRRAQAGHKERAVSDWPRQ